MALFQKTFSMLLTVAIAMMMLAPPNAAAHVVPLSKLSDDVKVASETRQANISAVQEILKTEQAKKLLDAANLDLAKAERAVTLLDDQELGKLAAQANQVQADLAAGLTRGQTSLIILAGAVVIIIIVIAAVA
jgi:hypothetical protein